MLGTRHWTALSKSKQWYPVVLNMDSWLTPVFIARCQHVIFLRLKLRLLVLPGLRIVNSLPVKLRAMLKRDLLADEACDLEPGGQDPVKDGESIYHEWYAMISYCCPTMIIMDPWTIISPLNPN